MFKVTTIHPVALTFTLLMALAILLVPRRFVTLPFLLVGSFITEIQRIVILGMDVTMLRLLVFVAFARILLRAEYGEMRLHTIDKVVILFTVVDFVAYVLDHGDYSALVNRLGFLLNTLGIYFFIRFAVRDLDDVVTITTFFAATCAVLALSMVFEQFTGRNVYAIFGGVPAFTLGREGHLRAQGAFPHSLLAGAYGAALVPVFWGFWRYTRKSIAVVGFVSSLLIVLTTFSSGPIVGVLAGVVGLLWWPYRYQMRAVRWLALAAIVLLSRVMKAPVWALVARFDIVGGSTGYHRYYLMDQAIRRFGEWWLIGTPSTANWGWGLWDVTNQYIAVGVEGGLLTLILFIAMIVLGFRNTGIAVRLAEPRNLNFFLWSFGVSLFVTSVMFIGMAYFGAQILVNWFFILGVLALAPQIAESVGVQPGSVFAPRLTPRLRHG